MDASAESARFTILFEMLDIQILYTYRRVRINVSAGEFMQKIIPLVCDMGICFLQFLLCFLPIF